MNKKFLRASFSGANCPMRRHTEALNSLRGAKGCTHILASGCSAWHRPGGGSSLFKAWPSLPTSVPADIYRLEPLVLLLWLQ